MASNTQNGDGGRSRGPKEASAEERAIQTMMDKGEQDLALKREARARARKLRLEELQRQKENEERREGGGSSTQPTSEGHSSVRLDLEDSLPEDPAERLAAIGHQLKDTLLLNSQLHSDKMQLVYQLDMYKDRLEDFDQDTIELRHYNRVTKQDLAVTQHQLRLHEQQVSRLRQEIEARDNYLKESNVPWPPPAKEDTESKGEATPAESIADGEDNGSWSRPTSGRNSLETEDLSVDEKKKRVDSHAREKQFLLEQIGRLKQEVILLKNELQSQALTTASTENGAVGRDVMRDTARLLSEYKTKLLALETDKARLEGQMQRADAQVKRLRTQREEAEKLEDELKSERRKLQRDVRTSESKAEELELENERLQKRIEALRKRHQKE